MMPESLPIRVIKVGGSLFDRPDLPARLASWLRRQPPARNLFVAGGGELVEEVRRWDERFRLGDAAHWYSIQLLSTTARFLSFLLPDSILTTNPFDVRVADSTRPVVLDPAPFLQELEPTLDGARLPCGWMTTSDSIAARVSEILGATELVILKSTSVLIPHDALELSGTGIVDAHFPVAVAHVKTWRVCQLG